MEKVYLGTAQYDGGWYSYLVEVHSHNTVKESTLHNTELQAIIEGRRWARDNERIILWYAVDYLPLLT
jgi:hypothetical protein